MVSVDRARLSALLAGIHTGVIGGLVALFFWMLSAPLIGGSWYTIPNLLAAGLYDRYGLARAGAPTVGGAALHIASAGVLGAVHAFAAPRRRLAGIAIAAAWYLFCYFVLWRRTSPALLAAPLQPALVAGFLLYGSVLGWHAEFARRVRL